MVVNRFGATCLAGLCGLVATFAFLQTASAQESGGNTLVSSARSAAVAPATPRMASKSYYVEFRSRSAHNYGHTFAIHGAIGQKITKDRVVGLHPATESPIPWMIGHILLVPAETGASDGDTEDEYITSRFRVLLTQAEYAKVRATMRHLQDSSPVWHATLYNCNAFVADIARSMGLRTPSSTLLMPKDYITQLGQLNTGNRQATATAPVSSTPVSRE